MSDLPPFSIRPATLEDAEPIAAFLKALHYFHRLEAQPLSELEDHVRAELRLCLSDDSHSVCLAESAGGELLGYVNVHWLPYLFLPGPEGYVSELFVAEAARGQGIGARLLEFVKEEAGRRGASRLSLINLRDRESYRREFYSKNGWGEREDAANFILDMRG